MFGKGHGTHDLSRRGGAGVKWIRARSVVAIVKMKGEAGVNGGQTETVTVMTGNGASVQRQGVVRGGDEPKSSVRTGGGTGLSPQPGSAHVPTSKRMGSVCWLLFPPGSSQSGSHAVTTLSLEVVSQLPPSFPPQAALGLVDGSLLSESPFPVL